MTRRAESVVHCLAPASLTVDKGPCRLGSDGSPGVLGNMGLTRAVASGQTSGKASGQPSAARDSTTVIL